MNPFFLEQASMYLAYHRNPKNRATHYIGVPAISFAILIPMSWVHLFQLGDYTVSLSTLFLFSVSMMYLWMDLTVGLATALLFVPVLLLAEFAARTGLGTGGVIFAVAFVGGWIFQLIGHAFEGRKPALADNLFQIFVSPMFLVAELFFALGLKHDLQTEMESRWVKYAANAAPKSPQPG